MKKVPNTSPVATPLQTLATVMDLLLHEEDLMAAVEQSLKWIGELSNQDRAYLFEIHTHPETKRVLMSQRCEWVREGIPPEIDNPSLVSADFLDILPRWHDTFFKGQEICGAVRNFPQEEQDLLRPQKIQAILVVPVFEKNLLRGFIGFDNCHEEYPWNDDEVALLRNVASAIGAGMGRQKNLNQLKASEERFRNLLDDISTVAVRGFSKDGIIQYWNKACEIIYGYSAEEALGKSIYDLIVPESKREHVEKKIGQLMANDQVVPEEIVLNHQSGTPVTVLSSYTRIIRPGFADEFFNLDVDLTDYIKMEQQFLRSQRMEAIGALAGGIAHDLNNILSPIMMSVSLLRSSGNSEQEPLFEVIEASTSRAAEMVMQILSFERGIKGLRVHVDVHVLVDELSQLLKDTLPKNIKFQTEIQEGLPPLSGDPTQLQQVLLNLSLNARDAMMHGGHIHLMASTCSLKKSPLNTVGAKLFPGDYLKLRVQDTGEGMSQEVQMKIFEPFFSTKAEDKGTGLGLSSSLSILKSHGGAVELKSEVGKGTTFTIYLPTASSDRVQSPTAKSVHVPTDGRGFEVLVVDDENNIRDILRSILEKAGYIVREAENGKTGLDIYTQHKDTIKLVIMDIMMPFMDGKTAIEKIRLIQPTVPILASSGLYTISNMESFTSDAHIQFIAKPYHSENLLMKVSDMLTARYPDS